MSLYINLLLNFPLIFCTLHYTLDESVMQSFCFLCDWLKPRAGWDTSHRRGALVELFLSFIVSTNMYTSHNHNRLSSFHVYILPCCCFLFYDVCICALCYDFFRFARDVTVETRTMTTRQSKLVTLLRGPTPQWKHCP